MTLPDNSDIEPKFCKRKFSSIGICVSCLYSDVDPWHGLTSEYKHKRHSHRFHWNYYKLNCKNLKFK